MTQESVFQGVIKEVIKASSGEFRVQTIQWEGGE